MVDTLTMAVNTSDLGKFVSEKVPTPTNDYQFTIFILGAVLFGSVWAYIKFGKKTEGAKSKEDEMTTLKIEFNNLKERVSKVEKLEVKIEGIENEMDIRFSSIEDKIREHKSSSQNNFEAIYKKLDSNHKDLIDILKR